MVLDGNSYTDALAEMMPSISVVSIMLRVFAINIQRNDICNTKLTPLPKLCKLYIVAWVQRQYVATRYRNGIV